MTKIANRNRNWPIRAMLSAKLLMHEFLEGPEETVKELLKQVKSDYFTKDLAMLIHFLERRVSMNRRLDRMESHSPIDDLLKKDEKA